MITLDAMSVLDLGPSGAGKSHFACSAVQALGGGLILLAPGEDERQSYASVEGIATIRAFDDPDFYPALGEFKTEGYAALVATLRKAREHLTLDRAEGKPPRYPVLVTDTLNNMLYGLAMNETYKKFGRTEPPPAISPDGGSFYGYLRMTQESLVRGMRAIKGLGAHWIATSHVQEKELKSNVAIADAAGTDEVKAKYLMPAIPGGYRDTLPGVFDLVLYAGIGINKEGQRVHYMSADSSTRRPSKARAGVKVSGKMANTWEALVGKIESERIRGDGS